MEAVETIKYRGHVITIYPDENPESPREWDNLGTIVYRSGSRHELGDDAVDPSEFQEFAKCHNLIILPVYAYIHSGIWLKTSSFQGLLPQSHAEFDSGQSGWIYVEKSKVRQEYSWKIITPKRQQQIIERLEDEIRIFNQYLQDDIYGYMIEGPFSDDSCWGYYGLEDPITEAKSSIDYEIEQYRKQHQKELKTQIRHKVPYEHRSQLAAIAC